MASETATTDHSSGEVEKEIKPEVKIMEPVQVCPPKESVDSPEPGEAPLPVSTFAESGAKVEETKTEPIVMESIKGFDTDENPKAEESVVLGEESEQKSENKQVEVPEKKTEDASNNIDAEVEKLLDPEPHVNIEGGEPEEKLDTETVEKQEESKVEPSVVGEPEKTVQVSEQLPAERAAREYIGNVEVLPDEELGESETELARVEKLEEKKDDLEKIINAGEQSSLEGDTEEKLDTGTVENQEESKVEPSVEEKIGEPEKVVESSKHLPAKIAAREYIGNVEVLPDKEMEESEAELTRVEKAGEKKDELEKIINAGEQSSIEAVEEKVENVDENPGEQVEAIEEKEVKDAESKPEEITETEPNEKLEQSTAESVEEKPEEPSETVQVPLQSSVDPVEEKVEILEDLPNKEAQVIVEKEGAVSEAEPAEKQKEFKLVQNDEKVDEPTKLAEHCSTEPVEEIVESTLPAKEVEETALKEVDVSETEIKPEEIPERKSVESVENISVDPMKIVDDPKQSSVGEKVEELPEKDVEADVKEEVIVPESECKHEEISDAEPSGKLEESKFGLPEEKPDEPKEEGEAVEEKDKRIEKVEEVPTNIVEEIQDTKDKETKVSEVESKPEEISETKPVESVEEKPVELEKIVDVPVLVSVSGKLGEAEGLPAKQMETIEDKVQGEIPETEQAKKLEESEVASVEEKPDESIKVVDVQEQSSPEIDKDKTEKGVGLPTKEVEAISEKEIQVPEAEFKHEDISETEPAEKQDESKLELVEENLNEPKKIVDVPEQSVKEVVEEKVGSTEESPAKDVDATVADAAKVSEDENKPEEINETKPVETIEGQSVEPKKIVDVAEKPSVEAVKEKSEKVEESPCTVVEDPVEKESKVLEAELKPEEIVKSTPEAKLVEQSKVTELHDKDLPCAEPLGKETKVLEDHLKPEEICESTPEEKLINQSEVTEHEKENPAAEPSEKEATALEAELKPEDTVKSTPEAKLVEQSKVTELNDKELPSAEPSEKEVRVLEDALKPEEISESAPEEKLIEQSEVTEQSEKVPPVAEPVEKETKVFEAEFKPEEISGSKPNDELIKQSEVTEQSGKEPPTSEPVEQGKKEALAEKEDETELLDKDEPTILETRIKELPEKADAPNDQEKSVKKIVEIDPQPEEKVIDPGKNELETEAQEEKSVATRDLNPCEDPNPTESEAIGKLMKQEVTSRDETLADHGITKKEVEVEENGHEEARKEAEKCEPATQIENIGRSLKEKLEQENRDDETTKNDVQTEATNESEDTKAAEDESKEEVPVKTTQKQSHNIMKMVKHSLVKAKKAIIGKSTNSKAPVSEINSYGESK